MLQVGRIEWNVWREHLVKTDRLDVSHLVYKHFLLTQAETDIIFTRDTPTPTLGLLRSFIGPGSCAGWEIDTMLYSDIV